MGYDDINIPELHFKVIVSNSLSPSWEDFTQSRILFLRQGPEETRESTTTQRHSQRRISPSQDRKRNGRGTRVKFREHGTVRTESLMLTCLFDPIPETVSIETPYPPSPRPPPFSSFISSIKVFFLCDSNLAGCLHSRQRNSELILVGDCKGHPYAYVPIARTFRRCWIAPYSKSLRKNKL